MFNGPIRGGCRGGKDQFKWDDIKNAKDKEAYLGNSLMAPSGRWAKNRDFNWYTKAGTAAAPGSAEASAAAREEIARIKAQEAEALASVLGIKTVIPEGKQVKIQPTPLAFAIPIAPTERFSSKLASSSSSSSSSPLVAISVSSAAPLQVPRTSSPLLVTSLTVAVTVSTTQTPLTIALSNKARASPFPPRQTCVP
ncbi:hypothetical protein CAOG_005405 [Capsaspora owczarzaki ATCC 30864]|uniref:Multiple myeloma tumor-associated protein 2-like N-terminal domain-containing protein n=1 Tax=Capsaspora owczarzaki (strain ATCC 30864) TaxID=595528 RepID=A0A0D2WT90_CAPO3|nr:hypothetical protein CAOG_005405 [Capsaspora owczarzaki ATCC 30864]